MLRRRAFLLASTAGALAACATTSAPTVDATILSYLQAAVVAVPTVVGAILSISPKAFSADVSAQITSAETAASTALQGVISSTPVTLGASAMQVAENALAQALQLVGPVLTTIAAANPAAAALQTAVTVFDAVLPLLPAAETWIASILGGTPTTTAAAAAPLKAIHTAYSPAAGYAVLQAHGLAPAK